MSCARCEDCKKKIGLMSFPCQHCKKDYCLKHRTPEEHKCPADYRNTLLKVHEEKIMNAVVHDTHNYVKI